MDRPNISGKSNPPALTNHFLSLVTTEHRNITGRQQAFQCSRAARSYVFVMHTQLLLDKTTVTPQLGYYRASLTVK
jgi:hypothetical protein